MKAQQKSSAGDPPERGQGPGGGHVLVFHNPTTLGAEQVSTLAQRVLSAEIQEVHSLRAYREALTQRDYDVVVLDYDIPGVPSRELLMQLQLRDHEPEVLLVSACDNPQTVKSIAAARKRYVVRDGNWGDEVSYAIRDMLRIRRLEDEMSSVRARLTEANRRLEEKSKRLDEFCATVAHDIRGPLAGLMLKIDYILSSEETEQNSRYASMLKRSYDSAQRLIAMVQAMYEYAKVGLEGVAWEKVDLRELITELVDDLCVDKSRNIAIGIGELPAVWGGAGLLRRVFINVISNAIKYNDKQSICVQIGYLGVEERDGFKFGEFFIEDNGPGIAEGDAERIFEMFSRGSIPAQHREGLGIGLAVVRRIVEMHHGEARVTSSAEGGARFIFSLPLEMVTQVP